MEHDEQKIEEIMTQLSPSAGMSHRIFGAEVARQYAENIRKQTIEECRGCVPKKSQFNKLFDYDDCREEYLSALNDLE